MKKIINKLKEYKLAILIASIIIVIGLIIIILILNHNFKAKKYENSYYTFKYDESWRISDKSDTKVELKNGNKADLYIELIKTDDEYNYLNLSDIIDEIIYEIGNQNLGYKLISKKSDKVTKSSFNGYKLLFESNFSQAMIVVTKIGDKIVIFSYEAKFKYFDIILDSVQNIIYNFKLKPDEFELSYKISVDKSDISYSKNADLVKKMDGLKSYDIAMNNYYVNYSLPNLLKLTSMNSKMGLFSYSEDGKKINITTNIYNSNIYDYLDSSKSYGNIYADYSYVKNDQQNYENFKENLSEFKLGKYNGYIYKVSYTANEIASKNLEVYIIAVELNKNHIFVIKIEGNNIKIPKELIDQIKINSVKNYSSYIQKNIINDMLNVELKRFSNYDYSEYNLVNIQIPEKYVELDKQDNIYENRYFGLNYDFNNDVYQYNIHYLLTTNYTSIDSQISLINSSMSSYDSYGDINEMSYVDTRKISEKNFIIYEGGYYNSGKLYNKLDDSVIYNVNRKVLIYKLDDDSYLIIIIDGNGCEIDDNILSDLTNFEIAKEVYNQ